MKYRVANVENHIASKNFQLGKDAIVQMTNKQRKGPRFRLITIYS
jgi:hypothetical protein